MALSLAHLKELRRGNRKLRTKKQKLDWIASEREVAMRDMDKTGDMDSYAFYSGLYEAYSEVLELFGRKLSKE
jgi:hypothetical protein